MLRLCVTVLAVLSLATLHANQAGAAAAGAPSAAATYGESRFGILTPPRVVGEWFDRTGGTKQKPTLTRAGLLTFTYAAFRRFEVATEDTITLPTR